jgi:hypothetical protein
MYGVDGAFVGDPIRGIIGDELPWEIAEFIRGKLDTEGRSLCEVWSSRTTLRYRLS